jgi:ABC-type transport system involved in multi-copper enzyme maturation permease subunit
MIRATLTAVPRREDVFVAKVVMTSLFAAGVSLASMLVALLWAALLLPSNAPIATWEVWNVILGVVLYSTMFSVVALALAAIFRNQIAALVFMFIVPTVFEQVIRAILVVPARFNDIQGAAKYLPFDAGGSMYSRLELGDALEIFGYEPLGPVGGGIVMGVFTAALLGLAGVLFLRRDI